VNDTPDYQLQLPSVLKILQIDFTYMKEKGETVLEFKNENGHIVKSLMIPLIPKPNTYLDRLSKSS